MSDIDLVVFDLAGTIVGGADHDTAAFAETLSSLALPIPPAEIESLRDKPRRDAIQEILLRYSPEQALAETIDSLYADYSRRLKGFRRAPAVRPLEGAEEVFRWLRQRGIKVALTTELDRKTVTQVTASLKWNTGVVDAVVCSEDVKAGPPAPFLIFRAMELTGVVKVGRVAVVGDKVRGLEAGATAEAGMNVGVLSGVEPREKLEAAPHTHLIESVRKFPSLLAAPAAATEAPPTTPDASPLAREIPPPAPEVSPPPPTPAPPVAEPPPKPPVPNPADPLGPGFTRGSGLQG